jgi:outer membrane protein TolC
LQALQNDAQALHARDAASREAQASLRIAGERYAAGGISQFALVDAERQALEATLERTKAQAARLADTAALYQSLGGAMLDADDARVTPARRARSSSPAQN